MIREVTMYQAVCDRCGKPHTDDIDGTICWESEESALYVALESGWEEIGGKLCCPACAVEIAMAEENQAKEI